MKKEGILLGFLLFFLIFAFALPAAADVMVEPDDLFYRTHRDECEYISARRYMINSENGYAYFYKNPQSKMTVGALSNGEKVTVYYLYTDQDGAEWGCVNLGDGWCRMSDVSLIYDSIAFMEEHGDTCADATAGTYALAADEATPIITWSYPGGEMKNKLTWDLEDRAVTKTFTDEQGHVWGYIPYERGIRNLWVCLDDPHSETVGGYAVEKNRAPLKAASIPASEIPANPGNVATFVGIGIAVALMVLSAVFLIFIFYGKSKKEV